MDANTLRSIVVNLRNRGLTYQAIADILYRDYGIIRTRQAVQGIYSRSAAQDVEELSDEKMRLLCDAVNIYSLGYNATKTTEMLNSRGYDIGYQKVIKLLKDNQSYIDNINNTMVANILSGINANSDPTVIRRMLSYDSIPVTENRFNQLIEDAAMIKIKQRVTEEIALAYRISSSKQVAKNLCQKTNLAKISDIETELRP